MHVSAWVRLKVQLAWGDRGEVCSSWEGRVLVVDAKDLSCSTRRHEQPGREKGMALRQPANFNRWSPLVHGDMHSDPYEENSTKQSLCMGFETDWALHAMLCQLLHVRDACTGKPNCRPRIGPELGSFWARDLAKFNRPGWACTWIELGQDLS